jgi:hypothetical protein
MTIFTRPQWCIEPLRPQTVGATSTRMATSARPLRRCGTPAALDDGRPPTVSHELPESKHESSGLAGTARTAASGVKRSPPAGDERNPLCSP